MMSVLGITLCVAGAILLLFAAWGVVRLPDALTRKHAATKAGTLALAVFILGAGFLMPEPAWIGRLILLMLLLLITLPLASHALARAAVREMGRYSTDDTGG
jgi:multicomponent Na+:H+ antiporter subunit G